MKNLEPCSLFFVLKITFCSVNNPIETKWYEYAFEHKIDIIISYYYFLISYILVILTYIKYSIINRKKFFNRSFFFSYHNYILYFLTTCIKIAPFMNGKYIFW